MNALPGLFKYGSFIFLLLLLLPFSCSENNELAPDMRESLLTRDDQTLPSGSSIHRKPRLSFPANGRRIHPDSIAPPQTIPLQGQPQSLPVRSNTRAVGEPKRVIIPEQLPRVHPGENGVPLPESIPVEVVVKPARQPKPVSALPPRISDGAAYDIQNLDVDQGMMSSYINYMLEDSKGFLWFGTSYGISRYDGHHFIHYTTEEGLMQNAVRTILEDSRGHLWFGTTNGITRYDGHRFIHYLPKTGAGRYEVRDILEDKRGNLWFGTTAGVLMHLPAEENEQGPLSFTHFTTREGLIDDNVTALLEDSRGHLWMGTANGVCRYDPDSGFTRYTTREGLTHNMIYSIEEDKGGDIWFGTRDGVTCYRPASLAALSQDSFVQFTRKEGLLGNQVLYILLDNQDNLWFGSEGGVSRYDGRYFTYYSTGEGLSGKTIRCLMEDSRKNLWFGSGGSGAYRLNPNGFIHLSAKEPFSNSDFTALAADSRGHLWFATEGAAILCETENTYPDGRPERFTYFTPREGLVHGEILSIMVDSRENVWFGTAGGVSRFDGKTFTNFRTEQGLVANEVKSFLEDSRGGIWMGSTSGISRYDGKTFTQFTTEEGLISNSVRCILEDRRGRIWLGTSEGVSCFEPPTNYSDGTPGYFTHFTTQEGLAGNDIRSILEDRQGNIWFGTFGNGLNCYAPDQELRQDKEPEMIHYTTQDGLSNNVIWSLLEDGQGNIWVSTEKGITLIETLPEGSASGTAAAPARSLMAFGKEEGLRRLDFQANSVCLDHQNRIWWGTISCVTMLDLNRFQLSTGPPQNLQIAHIEINQEFVDFRRLSEDAYRNQFRYGQDLIKSFDSVAAFSNSPVTMTLPYDLNHLAFHFSASDWKRPQTVKYRYFLKGVDKGWSRAYREPKVDYRNLPPRTYTLRVSAGLGAGKWSEPIEYAFVIRPPWWRTSGAYLGYFVIFLGFLYLIFYIFKKRWMLQSALAKEQEEAARLKELDSFKTRFFTNVSHELRTPLSLVLGPITSLLKEKKLTEKQKKLLRMANRSSRQLEHLVTEILDLGKLDMGKMELNEKPTRLSLFFRRYLAQFESLAQRKEIDFAFEIHPGEHLIVQIDQAKCRQILYNLLSNAFKFTPPGGKIRAKVSVEDGNLQLIVTDSGPGIHPDDLPHLFDRFFQTNRPDKPVEGGTGIGLALCHEYAQLFGGKIEVESEPGQGALFRITFPVEMADAPSPKANKESALPESLPDDSPPPSSDGMSAVPPASRPKKAKEEKTSSTGSKPTILVVEDNPELQDYLRLVLSKKYRVLTADNGQAALEQLAANGQPSATNCQLILSDLMMPVMDGYQLLERLKSDKTTRHLPVIMLTARADVRDKLKALRIGVDDYLLKPFDEEELLVRIDNLLKNQVIRSREAMTEPEPGESSPALSQTDREWLESFEVYVQKHFSNNILSVASLAREFAMSESTLLRQLKRLTGLTPGQYLQEVRLDEARRLLENQGNTSVALVAAKVGYGDARSFSRSFKKRFGKSPSRFSND